MKKSLKKQTQHHTRRALLPPSPDAPYKATWLELFFDLVFVAFVAQLTYQLSEHHHTVMDFVQVVIVGYMIFFAWWGTTVNRNLKQHDDVIDTLAIQGQMALVIIMSLVLSRAFDGYSWLFFGSFGLNGIMSLMIIRRFYRLFPDRRPNTLNIWWGFFIAALLWAAAGFTPDPYRYIVIFSALALQFLAPLTTGKGNTVILMNMHHLLERMGLFLLIIMGEAVLVVALVNSTAESFTSSKLAIVLSGLIQMVAFWWLYFPYIEKCATGRRARKFQSMVQGHALLYGSFIFTATGLKIILKHPDIFLWETSIFLAGIALMLTSFKIIQLSLTHSFWKIVWPLVVFLVALVVISSVSFQLQWPAVWTVEAVTVLLMAFALKEYKGHCHKNVIE